MRQRRRAVPRNDYVVYLLMSDDRSKCYVGVTTDIDRRVKEHDKNLRRGIHHCERLQADFDAGVRFDHEVIATLTNCTQKEAQGYERGIMRRCRDAGWSLYNTRSHGWYYEYDGAQWIRRRDLTEWEREQIESEVAIEAWEDHLYQQYLDEMAGAA